MGRSGWASAPCIGKELEGLGGWPHLGPWEDVDPGWEAGLLGVVAMVSCGCWTLLGLPQVNGTVESLGEKRGYAPFSPDENSLVLFDGRAAALGWGRAVSSCPAAQARRRDPQELSALTHAPPTTPRG